MTDRNEPNAPECPHCRATMQLVRRIEYLKELPDFSQHILLCALPPCGNGKAGAGGLNYAGLLYIVTDVVAEILNRCFALFLQR